LDRALDLEIALAEALEQPLDLLLGDVEGVVDVDAAASAGEADLLGPDPEPRRLADQVPVAPIRPLAVEGLLEPELVAVEPSRSPQVGDLEYELGDCAHTRRVGHVPTLHLLAWRLPSASSSPGRGSTT